MPQITDRHIIHHMARNNLTFICVQESIKKISHIICTDVWLCISRQIQMNPIQKSGRFVTLRAMSWGFKAIWILFLRELHSLQSWSFSDSECPNNECYKIIVIINSIPARVVFRHHTKVKMKLWGGGLWTVGYYVNSLSKHEDEKIIPSYVIFWGLINSRMK